MTDKYKDILNEVLDEIESALNDQKGIVNHQRRLAFSLSLGIVTLIENYLAKINVLKPGAKINHLWLKKKKNNVKEILSRQIVCPVENIKDIDKLIDVAYKIEKDRNEIAYGKPVPEKILREKINLFLGIKKEFKND